MEDKDRRDIKACLAGDEASYARLVKRYEGQVAAQMWRFSRDPLVCEELVQDVFVEAYLGLRRYRGDAPFVHWLRRIATRVGYRFWKKKGREEAHLPLEGIDREEARPESMDPSLAADILHALLGRLRRADRLVLTLMYFDKCSVQEIAQRTGWNRAVVKMRAHRARKKLRAIAEKEDVLEKLGWTH